MNSTGPSPRQMAAAQEIQIASQFQKEIDSIEQIVTTTRQEVKTLIKLGNNPNIVKIKDVIRVKHLIYLILEYCNQKSLATYWKAIRSSINHQSHLLHYFRQIINAFRDLYAFKIIHRDIKPLNILVHNHVLKVADFGFSRQIYQNHQALQQQHVGTVNTASPQIIFKEKYTNKCDVFSLGMTFYWMIYGIFPFANASRKEDYAQSKLNFPQCHMSLSQQLISLLKRMLYPQQQGRIGWQNLLNHPLVAGSVDTFDIGHNGRHDENGVHSIQNGERKKVDDGRNTVKQHNAADNTNQLKTEDNINQQTLSNPQRDPSAPPLSSDYPSQSDKFNFLPNQNSQSNKNNPTNQTDNQYYVGRFTQLGRQIYKDNRALDQNVPEQIYKYISDVRNSGNLKPTVSNLFQQYDNQRLQLSFYKLLIKELGDYQPDSRDQTKSEQIVVKDLIKFGLRHLILLTYFDIQQELKFQKRNSIFGLNDLNEACNTHEYVLMLREIRIQIKSWEAPTSAEHRFALNQLDKLEAMCRQYQIEGNFATILTKNPPKQHQRETLVRDIERATIELIYLLRPIILQFFSNTDNRHTLAEAVGRKFRQLVVLVHHLFMFLMRDSVFPKHANPQIRYDIGVFEEAQAYQGPFVEEETPLEEEEFNNSAGNVGSNNNRLRIYPIGVKPVSFQNQPNFNNNSNQQPIAIPTDKKTLGPTIPNPPTISPHYLLSNSLQIPLTSNPSNNRAALPPRRGRNNSPMDDRKGKTKRKYQTKFQRLCDIVVSLIEKFQG